MYFNLKTHNFKANGESVYKLSRFATGRMIWYYYKDAGFWKYLNIKLRICKFEIKDYE